MDRDRMLRCLEQVAAYQASGMRANEWAAAHGVALRALSSWCAHARRWQASIDGLAYEPAAARRGGGGFVAASIAPAGAASAPPTASIRIELPAGAGRIDVYWPMMHARELAAWLREFGR